MKRIVWVVALLAILAGAGLAYQKGYVEPLVAKYVEPWFARSAPAPAKAATSGPAGAPRGGPAVPVLVAEAVQRPTPVRFDTIGTVQTIANVVIKSRIDGFINDVLVKDGQFVHAGDVMFKLDSRAATAQLNQVSAQLLRDRAQLTFAQLEVKRLEPLLEKSFASRQSYEQAESNSAALTAAMQADQAAIENAKVQLTYLTLTAPIDGRIGMVMIKTGNSIKSNDLPLATINQITPIYVMCSLPQSEFPALRDAMNAGTVAILVQPAGDSGAPEQGRIEFFDNTVDTSTGTIAVRAIFPNAKQRLWPGQFVNVQIVLRTEADALVVPQSAVQVGQNGSYVYVIKPDNTAEFRKVTVNRTIEGMSVVSDGLKASERVATDGLLRLVNGAKVEVRTAAEASPKKGAAS